MLRDQKAKTYRNSDHGPKQQGSEPAPERVGDEGSDDGREVERAGEDVVHVRGGVLLHVVTADEVAGEGEGEGVARDISCREDPCIPCHAKRARTHTLTH